MPLAIFEKTQQLFSKTLRIEGTSMEPSFADGSWVRISPFSYTLAGPQRGDVVALRAPKHSKRWELKRVVGLPNEMISWQGGSIWINGLYLPESYAVQSLETPGEETSRLTLSWDEFFVVGDNRLYSRDSRAYGAVNFQDIIGPVI